MNGATGQSLRVRLAGAMGSVRSLGALEVIAGSSSVVFALIVTVLLWSSSSLLLLPLTLCCIQVL